MTEPYDMRTTPSAPSPPAPLRAAPRLWLPLGIAVVGLVGAMFTRSILHTQEVRALGASTLAALQQLINELDGRLHAEFASLARMARRWEYRGGIPRAEFEQDAQRYVADYDHIQAIEWADTSFHVRWIVPAAGNEALQDLDLRFEARRRTALESARDAGESRITPVVDLVQGGKGFLVGFPIAFDGQFRGMILGLYRVEQLFGVALHNVAPDYGIDVRQEGAPFFQRPGVSGLPSYARSATFRVLNAEWTVSVAPSAAVVSTYVTTLPLSVGLSSALGVLSLALCVHLWRFDRWRVTHTAAVNQLLAAEMEHRTAAQAALRESEATLRLVLDLVPHMVFARDEVGQFVLANRSVADAYGTTPDALRGQYVGTVHSPAAEVDRMLADEREVMATGCTKLIAEETFTDARGRVRILETTKIPFDPKHGGSRGILGVSVDITARKETEEALRHTSEELSRVTRSISAYLWSGVVDSTGHIDVQYYSPVVETITGRPPSYYEADLTRKLETIHPDDRDRVEAFLDAFCNGTAESASSEYRVLLPDGTVRWVRDSVRPTTTPDGRIRLDGVVADITERKRAEEEQRKLEIKVQQVQKLESLGVLAGGIAHDFNNLLVGILGNADLARGGLPPTSPATRDIDAIVKAAKRASDLCRQMLAYSGKGRFVVAAIDLRELVRDMMHLLEVSIPKGISIDYQFAAEVSAINADATQIRQVVMNLITNAAEAIGDNAGTISLRIKSTYCDAAYLQALTLTEDVEPGDYVSLEVSDTGCGMSGETLDRLFDPFYTTKFTGRGLGLAAVLGIVRGHDGVTKVYSEPGRGTTFKVLFKSTDQPAHPAGREPTFNSAPPGDGIVLLIDDEETVRDVGVRMLERAGYTAVAAANGPEAVRIFRDRHHEICCVILDLTMPGMDGEDVFRELRRINPTVRVVLSSGYNEQDLINRWAGKGLAGFLQKPYVAARLMNALHDAVGVSS